MPSSRLNLTPAVLKALPADGQEHHFSDVGGPKSVAGLAVRVRPSGAASFVLNKRVSGRLLRVTLGAVGALTLGEARDKARQTLADMTLTGVNPNEAKRARRDRGVTLETAFTDYLAACEHKPTTVANYHRAMRLHLARWRTRPLVEITRTDVRALYRTLAARSPSAASAAMRLLRAVFNHAIDEYHGPDGTPLLVENPVGVLSRKRLWKAEEPRSARIRAADLARWFEAVETLRETTPTTADYLTVLLLTGMRRREAAPLRWRNVNLKARTLTVADTKSGRPLTIPLSAHVVELLTDRRDRAAPGAFVFPGTGKSGHIEEPKKACTRIAELVGIDPADTSPHALRRTFVSVGESIELSAYVLKRLVGHAVSKRDTLGEHYVEIEAERLATATQRITDAMLSHASATAGANVVALRARA